MKLVYICSPLRGDMEANLKRAMRYNAYAAGCGVIPIAPHVAWNGVFDDTNPEKRETALRLGLELLKRCDEVWVMGNEVSEGMQGEIDEAEKLHIPRVYVLDEQVEKDMKIRQAHQPLSFDDCIPDSDQQNYEGKILVVKPESLSFRYRLSENSLWIASHGPGCMSGKYDRTVHAYSLFTGELACFARYDFHGVVNPESLLVWLRDHPIKNEKANEIVQQARQERPVEQPAKSDLEWPYVIGHCNGESIGLVATAENIAAYIATKGLQGDLTITTPLDKYFLTTYGPFIDKCSDFDFMEQKLKPVLIPMQMGEVEPPPVEEYSGTYVLEDYEDELDGELEP